MPEQTLTEEEQVFVAAQFDWVTRWIDRLRRRKPWLARLADDLLSDANLALLKAFRKTQGGMGEKPEHYCRRAIKRAVVKRIKASRIKWEGNKLSPLAVPREIPASNFRRDPFEVDTRRDKSDALLSRIDECCEDDIDRRIVELRLSGEKVKEVATALGISRESVRRRLRRIWKLLRIHESSRKVQPSSNCEEDKQCTNSTSSSAIVCTPTPAHGASSLPSINSSSPV